MTLTSLNSSNCMQHSHGHMRTRQRPLGKTVAVYKQQTAVFTNPADVPAMPVPRDVARELQRCLIWRGSESFLAAPALARLSHLASRDAKRVKGLTQRDFNEFMVTLAPLFQADGMRDSSDMIYASDVVVCMLQDCHGIVVDSERWAAFKQVHGPGDSRASHSIEQLAWQDTGEDQVGDLFLRNAKMRRVESGSSGLGSASAASASADSDSNSCGSFRCKSSDTRSSSSVGAVSASASGVSSRTPRDETCSVLATQITVLKKMLAERDAKISDQNRTLKFLKLKCSRNEKTIQKLVDNIRTSKLTEGKFQPTRVMGEKAIQKQVRHLDRGRYDAFVQSCDTAEDPFESGWLTPQGNISVAIRRNVGNASAQDLGLILMVDVSKQTVLRAECRTGAALTADAQLWFLERRQELEETSNDSSSTSTTFFFLQYREDATNKQKNREKLTAMEAHASFAVAANESELQSLVADDFTSIRRLADVLPVHCGTGPATLALCNKMLQSLQCPSWEWFLARHKGACMSPGRIN